LLTSTSSVALFIIGLLSKKLTILRSQSIEQLEMDIVSQYHTISLGMAGFVFARADKGRRLQRFAGSCIAELESFIGKGKLIVIPKRDLTMPEAAEPQQVSIYRLYIFQACKFNQSYISAFAFIMHVLCHGLCRQLSFF